MCTFKKFNHKLIELSSEITEVEIDGTRFYSTPGGTFPSVTTVTGFEKKQFFAEWRERNPEESKRVTSRGTKFHSTIESYLKNEQIDLENMMPGNKALFLLLKPELDKIDNILALETPLWSKTVGLAGRTDCIAEYDGKLSIIDFKASSKEKKISHIDNYFTQATAYSLMFQERTGIKINNFVILIASEDGMRQVFQGNPIKYVKDLHKSIKKYKASNEDI